MTAGSPEARIRGFYGVVDLRPAPTRPAGTEPESGIAGALAKARVASPGIEGALAHAARVDGLVSVGGAEHDREHDLVLGRGLDLARQLVSGGASVVQLRMKGAPVRRLLDVAEAVLPIVRGAGALFIVNDRLDVALAVGADGVHLGQDDLPLEAARAAAGGRLLIGISTHSVEQAVDAACGGADYLGYGPVFATSSKENPDPEQGIEGLVRAVAAVAQGVAGSGRSTPPLVAIGGITPERAGEIARAGAAAACVIAAVNAAPDVTLAARRVAAAFGRRA